MIAVQHVLRTAAVLGVGEVDCGRHGEEQRRAELDRGLDEPAGDPLLVLGDAVGRGDVQGAKGLRINYRVV